MKPLQKPLVVGTFVFALISAVGLLWYGNKGTPMTPAEIDASMVAIEKQAHIFKDPDDLEAFRTFLMQDDGAPFYTVNFYQYHPVAQYEDAVTPELSGREAYDRFSNTMIKLLAAEASHPIFGTDWVAENQNNWDRLVIVRYRSRSAIAAVFANPEFAKASIHKWAALKRNERFLAQGLHIPALHVPLLFSALLAGLLAALLTARVCRQA